MKTTVASSDGLARPGGERAALRAGLGGFSIIEAALALAMMALALSTSIAVLQRSFLQADTARNLEVASQIMQCEMEKERLFTWVQLNNPVYVPTIDTDFARNPAISGRFTLSRSVTAVSGRAGQVVQVTLVVQWRAYDGRSLSRSYTSYFTQRGLNTYMWSL